MGAAAGAGGRGTRAGTLAAALGLAPALGAAQEAAGASDGAPPLLPAITVSMPRGSVSSFDVPASIDRVEGTEPREGRLQAQLSEGLGGVPGLQV